MSEDEDVKQLLGRAFGQEPPLGIDRDVVLAQGRKRLRRRRFFEAGSVVAAVVIAAVGAATLTNLVDTEERIPPAASSSAPAPPGPDLPLPPTSGESLPVAPTTTTTNLLPDGMKGHDTERQLTQLVYNTGVMSPDEIHAPPGEPSPPTFTRYGEQYVLVADLIRPKHGVAGSLKITIDYAPGIDANCKGAPQPYLKCSQRRVADSQVTVASMRDEDGKRNYASTVSRSGLRVTAVVSNQTYQAQMTGKEPEGQPALSEDELCVLVSKAGVGAA